MLKSRFPGTLELSLVALVISTIMGLVMGYICAIKQNTAVDYFNTAFGLVSISVPNFFTGISFLLIFAVRLRWFPVGGRLTFGAESLFGRLYHLFLPAFVLSLVNVAGLMRSTRTNMLDVLGFDYIKTARSKGLPQTKVYLKHALRNAFIPIMLVICGRFPMLFGGSVVIETVFGWPGMGNMILQGVGTNDYPVVMATILVSAILVLLASLMMDIFTAALDPRVRIG
jgi:peptide/nickel transport system permease protein